MFRYLLIILLAFSGSVFAQHSKKHSKEHPKELHKEISKEHFKDFKIIMDMIDSAKKISSLRCNMKSLERIEDGYASAATKVKLQMHPRRSYLINTEKKLEVLYNEGEGKDKC